MVIVLASFAVVAAFTSRVTEWFVMTDELQYTKLALAIARDGALRPELHGEYYPSLNQLYPLLLAPALGLLDMPDAFRAAHLINAAMVATAAVPAYLLVARLTGSRWAGVAAAALTQVTPWVALAAGLVTEVVAYPVILWSLLALQVGLSKPGVRGDLIAGLGATVAFFARTQFIVLFIAYPLAVVLHEAGWALSRPTAAERRTALRTALRRHVVLWVALAMSAFVVVPLALRGELARLLGQYAGAARGDLFPDGLLLSMALHFDWIVVGLGVLPAVLAVGWALESIWRPSSKEMHAFAVLGLILGTGFAVQVASYSVRLVGGNIQTRYLLPLVPLLIVGAVACCMDSRRRWRGVLVATAAVAAVIALPSYVPAPAGFGSPDALWHAVLFGRAQLAGGALGLQSVDVGSALRWTTVAAGMLLAVALIRLPRRVTLLTVTAALLAYGSAETGYVLNRVTSEPSGARPVSGGTLAGRDWVDRALPEGARAAIVPVPITGSPIGLQAVAYFSQTLWFDQEFWNKDIDQAWVEPGLDPYTPFPNRLLEVDHERGRIDVDDDHSHLVVSSSDTRFALRGRVLARTPDVELLETAPPYRLRWASEGVSGDGGALGTARVRLYGDGGSERQRRTVDIELVPSLDAGGPQRWTLRAPGARTSGTLRIGDVQRPRLRVCVPARGHTDAVLRFAGVAPGEAARVRVKRIEAPPAGAC